MNFEDMTLEEYEKWLVAYSFYRSELRVCRTKRLLDCGHWVDGSVRTDDELYLYIVYRTNDMPKGQIIQQTMCEICARGL